MRRRLRRGCRRPVSASGSCRWRSPGSRRSATVGRSRADGESSDGAGVSLPLERHGRRAPRPGHSARRRRGSSALPAARRGRRCAARRARRGTSSPRPAARRALAPRAVDPTALGPAAAASRPVVRPSDRAAAGDGRREPRPFERRLVVARRRLETAAPTARTRRAKRSPSASSPDDRLQGPRRRRPARGALSGPRRPVARQLRDLPPALRDEHAPDWRARPAVPAHRPQRRDQHGARQPRAGPRAAAAGDAGRARGAAAARRRPAPRPGRLRFAVARRGGSSCSWRPAGTSPTALLALDPRGAGRCASAAPAGRRVPAADRRLHGAVGRSGGARVRRRPAGRRAARPQRAAAAGLRGDARRAGRRRVGGRRRADRRRPRPSDGAGSGPGELLLVDPGAAHDPRGRARPRQPSSRRSPIHDAPRPDPRGRRPRPACVEAATRRRTRSATWPGSTPSAPGSTSGRWPSRRHEPLWSMGDDTPTPGRGRVDRRVVDHLRQSFAQVTNPPIDPERERVVMDLRVELGRRAALLGGPPRPPSTVRLERPIVADLDGLSPRRSAADVLALDATWDPPAGPRGLEAALERLADQAVAAARRGRPSSRHQRPRASASSGCRCRRSSPSARSTRRSPRPGCAAGPTSLADAADILDVHALAMALAAGATAVHPRLAIELAAELAGTRGAEDADAGAGRREPRSPRSRPGLRKTLARMGISTAASYIGGPLFETLELAPAVVAPLLPGPRRGPGASTSPTWRAASSTARATLALPEPPAGPRARLPDPGLARFRGDGEPHLYAPTIVETIQAIADAPPEGVGAALAAYRRLIAARPPAPGPRRASGSPRGAAPVPLGEVEPARVDRPALRGVGDERRRAVARGAPGADDRHPARRRRREHRRGRRGPGLVRPDGGRPAARRPDQAGRVGAVRRDRGVPRARRPARDQDRPGLEAGRGRPAARRRRRRPTSRRCGAVSSASLTSARRRTTTSTRSRTSPSSSPTCARSTRTRGSA